MWDKKVERDVFTVHKFVNKSLYFWRLPVRVEIRVLLVKERRSSKYHWQLASVVRVVKPSSVLPWVVSSRKANNPIPILKTTFSQLKSQVLNTSLHVRKANSISSLLRCVSSSRERTASVSIFSKGRKRLFSEFFSGTTTSIGAPIAGHWRLSGTAYGEFQTTRTLFKWGWLTRRDNVPISTSSRL